MDTHTHKVHSYERPLEREIDFSLVNQPGSKGERGLTPSNRLYATAATAEEHQKRAFVLERFEGTENVARDFQLNCANLSSLDPTIQNTRRDDGWHSTRAIHYGAPVRQLSCIKRNDSPRHATLTPLSRFSLDIAHNIACSFSRRESSRRLRFQRHRASVTRERTTCENRSQLALAPDTRRRSGTEA